MTDFQINFTMKRYILMIICSVLGVLAMAQTNNVTGKVTDSSGEPLAGVFVLQKGTDNGASTNASGEYSITVPADASLVFTCIGFQDVTMPVKGFAVIDVTMEEDSQLLDEIVVVGYGSQKSKDLTAPIVNIKGDDLKRHIASSPMSGIQGRVSGVQIVSSGAPGASPSVKIRGSGSIGDYAQPLYVVDGAFVDNLDFISPDDIQELTVLKDASASAIYGVRAANGVVIITTKRGSQGSPSITYDGYVGMQIPVNEMKLADKSQYIDMLNEANAAVSDYEPKDPSKFPAGVGWYSVLLRNAMTQNHSLSVSGATDKTNYSAGLSYFNQEGILDSENAYDRLNFRSKLDQKVTSWLSVGVNVLLSRYTRTSSDNNAFFQAFVNPPVYNVYNDSNEAAYPVKYDSPQLYGFGNSYANPVAVARYNENTEKGTNLVFSTYAQLSLLNDKLNFKTSYNLDYQSYRNQGYVPEYFVGGSQGVSVSTLTKIYGLRDRHVIDNTVTYTDRVSKHNFSLMAGQSVRVERFSAIKGSGINVPDYDSQSLYIDNGSNSGSSVSDKNPAPYLYHGVSFFTRGTYNYADRYLATVTFRADGSSKYNKKWGFFPSVGLGWVLTSEPYMKDYLPFDFLKLRVSWGMLGNDNVPANSTVILGSVGTSVSGVFGDNLVDGIGAQTVYQNYLRWEVVNEYDAGVDFTILEGRFSGELDYYDRTTENVVFYVPIATGGGTAELLSNNGTVRNSGFELTLGWSDFVGEDITYNIGLNLTTVSNKVVELQGRDYIPGASVRGNYSTRTQVGLPIGAFWGYIVDGVFASDQEVSDHPIQQEIMAPGYFKYRDMDGNRIINENDKTYLGSPIPRLTGGLDFGFAWKNLDFGLTLYWQLGNKILNAKRMNRDVFTDGNYDLDFYQNAWRPGRPSDTYPSAAAYNSAFVQQANSFFVEDASFFRIQNVQVGYTFRNLWKINMMRVYFSAQRPLTLFRYNGFTPEVGGSPIANGVDTSTYPMQAICTLGLRMSF
jgi:TonB-linked SusC/RagA family outer membrane protein